MSRTVSRRSTRRGSSASRTTTRAISLLRATCCALLASRRQRTMEGWQAAMRSVVAADRSTHTKRFQRSTPCFRFCHPRSTTCRPRHLPNRQSQSRRRYLSSPRLTPRVAQRLSRSRSRHPPRCAPPFDRSSRVAGPQPRAGVCPQTLVPATIRIDRLARRGTRGASDKDWLCAEPKMMDGSTDVLSLSSHVTCVACRHAA